MNILTYSETVYLFADKFITDRAKLVNYDQHPSGEKIPAKLLSQMMVEAALVYLRDKGFIESQLINVKKLFLFSGQDVSIKRIKNPDNQITGIEAILMENIDGVAKVKKAVYNLLPDDESSPWGQIINISKKSLADKKVLQLEDKAKSIFSVKKYLYDPKILDQYKKDYDEVKKALSDFLNITEISKLTSQAVKSGMAARLEQSSSDD